MTFKIVPSSISSFIRSIINKHKASTLFFCGFVAFSISSYYIASYFINKRKDNKNVTRY